MVKINFGKQSQFIRIYMHAFRNVIDAGFSPEKRGFLSSNAQRFQWSYTRSLADEGHTSGTGRGSHNHHLESQSKFDPSKLATGACHSIYIGLLRYIGIPARSHCIKVPKTINLIHDTLERRDFLCLPSL